MKIDACLIIKNEEKNIDYLLNQLLQFADEIHLTDTGSTDKTIEIITNFSKEHPNIFLHHFEWCNDFAKARNYSFNCYKSDSDYRFWCDADDQIPDALIKKINQLKSENGDHDVYNIKYQYFKDNENYWIWRNTLIKKDPRFKWIDPIHEFITFETDDPDIFSKMNIDFTYFVDDNTRIIHQLIEADSIRHNHRNWEILMDMEKNHYNFGCRNRYYYGRESCNEGYIDLGCLELKKCIDIETNDFIECLFKNLCLIMLFKHVDKQAIEYYHKMLDNNWPVRKDVYNVVGQYYEYNQKYQTALTYYIMCLSQKEPVPDYTYNYDFNCNIDSLMRIGIIYNNVYKNPMEALEYLNQAFKLDPNNQQVKQYIDLIQKNLNKS